MTYFTVSFVTALLALKNACSSLSAWVVAALSVELAKGDQNNNFKKRSAIDIMDVTEGKLYRYYIANMYFFSGCVWFLKKVSDKKLGFLPSSTLHCPF